MQMQRVVLSLFLFLNYGSSSSSGGRESKSQTSGWQHVTPSVMTVKNLIGFSRIAAVVASSSSSAVVYLSFELHSES